MTFPRKPLPSAQMPGAAMVLRHKVNILLVTPLRDEQDFIGDMIDSIASQHLRPSKWLIVDDGSTDSTPEIVRRKSASLEFIEYLRLPDRVDRKAGGEKAIAAGLGHLDLSGVDYIARFDADLIFEPDYFARIVDEFDRDLALGIAGGGLYVARDGALLLEKAPPYHVRGAVKMYRRNCFEQIGGLSPDIGWDTIDEVYAWSMGWRTRSFFEIPFIHRRPTGAGLRSRRIWRERGLAEYLTWSHPAFVLAKSTKISMDSPGNAWAFLCGFLFAYRQAIPRLQDARFKRTRRDQQLERMFSIKPRISRIRSFLKVSSSAS